MPERICDEAWQADHAFLQRIARGLLRDVHEAEDLTQEVWLASLRKDPSRSPSRNFLVGLARNLAVDRHRRRSRRFDVERGQSLPEGVPAPPSLLERESNRHLVASAVAGLREPYRTAILLRFFQELEAHSIAARLGLPVETVRTRIKRGLAQLEEELERGSGDRRSGPRGAAACVDSRKAEPPRSHAGRAAHDRVPVPIVGKPVSVDVS